MALKILINTAKIKEIQGHRLKNLCLYNYEISKMKMQMYI